MRLCCSSHAVIQLAKLKRQPRTRPSWQFTRSFASTTSITYAPLITNIHSDAPPYKPQAQPNPDAKSVAVVGGGITGLAAAYNLTKALPKARITLFEPKKRLGGWLDSELITVDHGEVLFEWGPRTLRSDGIGPGRYTAQLMAQLDMADDVLPTSATSPAALNRYIYYPDHLVRMPGPLPGASVLTNVVKNFTNVLQEPVFQDSIPGLLKEGRVDVRPDSMKDESVGDFVTRRFGRHVADNLVSALLHGIYAGDLYNLSAKTIFPLFWHLEKASEVGVVVELLEQMWNGESLLPYDDIEFTLRSDQALSIPEAAAKTLADKLAGSSVYTFKKGLAQLAERIEGDLRGNANVEIRNITAAVAYDADISSFTINDGNGQRSKSKDTGQYDYVVATISPLQLSKALQQDSPSSPLVKMLGDLHSSTSTVNVLVVNLFYRNPALIPVSGFGYLLPRSIPIEQNPERALGVIFGSETSGGSSNVPSEVNQIGTGQDSATGTKLTVMMGGHWWNSWPRSDLPDQESGIKMARAILERHLGITDVPVVAKARMQWDAIPQYEVGHHERMARVHRHLRTEFDGRLKVAGSAYQGVGVHDCVKAARKVTFDIREGFDTNTGLENFGQEMRWALYKNKERAVYMVNRSKNGSRFAG